MHYDDFLTALHARVPRAGITLALVVLNVAAYAVLAVKSASPWSLGTPLLLAWGGNEGAHTLSGEPWRLLSALFLHGSVLHVGLNMLALYQIGQLVERMFGHWRYLSIYLGAGAMASVASVWWRQDVVSIGASGAIFGLFGALLVYLLVHRRAIQSEVFRSLRKTTLGLIGYSLLIGFVIPGVDNAAHVGGLVGGLLLGAALASGTARGHLVGVLGLAASVALGVAMWQQIPAPVASRVPDAFRLDAVRTLIETQPELVSAEQGVVDGLRDGSVSQAAALEEIEQVLLPRWERLVAALAAEAPGTEDWRAAELLHYASARRDALRALALGLQTGHRAWLESAYTLRGEAADALTAYQLRDSLERARLAAPHAGRP